MSNKINVIFAGDMSTSRRKGAIVGDKAKELMKEVSEITANADYAIVNLENPINKDGLAHDIVKSGPPLYGLIEDLDMIKAGGFDCALLANNHTGDQSDQGVIDTLELLEENDITYLGAGKNSKEANKPIIFERNGISVGLINACENEFGVAGENSCGVAGFSFKKIFDNIASLKGNVDAIVVAFHGGTEECPFPSVMVNERYKLMIDMGADAVIAGHTHCPQGAEYYKGKPIVYSMGNFYFPATRKLDKGSQWDYGYMVDLTITDGGVVTYELLPYQQVEDYTKIKFLKGEEKAVFMEYIEKLSKPLKDENELRRLFEGWTLITGPAYDPLNRYDFKDFTNLTAEELENMAHVLNNFSCEAHRELLKNYYKLHLEGRRKEVEKYTEYVKECMKVPYID